MTTGEYDVPLAPSIEGAGEPVEDLEEMLTLGLDPRNLRILDALYHNAGLVASEDLSPPTPEELDDEACLAVFVERLIADD